MSTGGGIEAFLAMFIPEASKEGIRTTVLCPGDKPTAIGSVRIVPIMAEAWSERAFTRGLRRYLAQGRLQIPQSAVVLANTEHYVWAFRGFDVPIVLVSHGAIPATLRMRHNPLFVLAYRIFIERPALKAARRIVVVSPAVREYYRSSYPDIPIERYIVLPIGLDLDSLEARPRADPFTRLALPPSTPFVLFVGRLYPEKNPLLFVAACDSLRQHDPSIHAVIVGDGVLANMVKTAMDTRPWLHWVPVMSHSDVLDTMAAARALVVCSSYESGPLVLLEAIGIGTPVVSTDAGRARELISESLGRIVDSDAGALAEGMLAAIRLDAATVKAASLRTRKHIDFRDTMRSLGEVMDRALRQPNG